MVDFSQLGQDDSANTAIHPREIFNALPNNQYQYPRDVQTEVWNLWHDSRDEGRDSVIKMNTGSGKTIVGLLILKSCLNEGSGPAAYFSPDSYLAQQVRDEAGKLGLDVTSDPDSARFRGGDEILVTNIYTLVNGQSKFGVGIANIPIGSLVVDDVHACLIDTESQFTLDLGHEVSNRLTALFEDALHQQSPGALHEINRDNPNRETMVPYWTWHRRIDEVREIISEYAGEGITTWKWPLVNDSLEYATCFVSGTSAEISLRSLPIDIIRSLHEASRRIFMSATLSDDSPLISHFDCDVGSDEEAITPSTAGDAGDRLILMPQYLTPSIDEYEIREMADRYSDEHNVVVIVPSERRAEKWSNYSDVVLDSSNISEGVSALKDRHVGLTILLNKYDGVDLPGDACRLLIIDDLPNARRYLERYDQAVLQGSGHELTQPIQRIEQGMGRGVRSSEDYCAVVLMGNNLTSQLIMGSGVDKFTEATQTQYELSQQLSFQLEGENIQSMEEALDEFLDRDPDWVQASKSKLSQVQYDSSLNIRDEALKRRESFSEARIGNLRAAVDQMRTAVQVADSDKLQGLLMQEQAAYMNLLDRTEAQAIQRSAVQCNSNLLKPIEGTQYQRLTPTDRQASTAFQRLRDRYDEKRQVPVEINGLVSDLVFANVSHQTFEEALERAGWLLGFESHRPDADFGSGPDNLWRTDDGSLFTIECKNEATADEISKSYCNQVSGHVNWAAEKYGEHVDCTPFIIHPSHRTAENASPPQGMRVIDESRLQDFRNALDDFGTAVVENWETLDSDAVASRLNSLGLNGGQFPERFGSLAGN
jgi:replicative superfamily II helicase